jgi:O-antigen ligase
MQRLVLYNLAIDSFKSSPIIGNGIGSFSNIIGVYYYPHNIIIELLNDFGFIGFAIAFVLFCFVFKKCKQLLKMDIHYNLIVFFIH